jgi:hypothetical protein
LTLCFSDEIQINQPISIPQVYIGAVNRIYQLTPDLEVKVTETTGPKMDSPECALLDCPSHINRKLTNNTNKVLLIDYSTSRLIVCGTLFQGLCSVRSTQNISLIDQEVQEAVVANNEDASTVAFIAPGPPAPPSTVRVLVGNLRAFSLSFPSTFSMSCTLASPTQITHHIEAKSPQYQVDRCKKTKCFK